MNDPVIDLIIRIKNAYMTRNESLVSPHSSYREAVVKKLKDLGYVADYSVTGELKKIISIDLKYDKGMPAVTDVQVVSKPGKREYISYKDLKVVMSGLGYSILSTPQGIMTNKEARKAKLGGELLFLIW
jgi:small subunit ribosomal protein S8